MCLGKELKDAIKDAIVYADDEYAVVKVRGLAWFPKDYIEVILDCVVCAANEAPEWAGGTPVGCPLLIVRPPRDVLEKLRALVEEDE